MSKMITYEKLKEILEYDPETGIFRWKISARKFKIGDIAGSLTHGYIRIKYRGKAYKAHRLAWLYMTGEWPKDQIDHKDRIRANNKWENLREATNSENQRNKKDSLIFGVPRMGKYFDKYKVFAVFGIFDTCDEAVKFMTKMKEK